MDHDLISQAEAARLVGVTRGAINSAVANGTLEGVVVAGRRLVRRKEVELVWPNGPRKLSGPRG